ncbi:MAG TPA: hypothetical protein VM366_13565 [Anaerolineae bacterium]|nr:hypothetical protein [Anaerolineae bacterium]
MSWSMTTWAKGGSSMTHFATHHFRVRWAAFQYIRRYHLHHHTQTPDQRFGVTSPLWDTVLGTKPD